MQKKTIQILFLLYLTKTLLSCTLKTNKSLCTHCSNNQCTQCQHSYIKNGQCILPNSPIKNCLNYLFDGKCQNCEPSFFLKKNKCEKIKIPNCYKGSENFCEECFEGIKAKNGKCDFDKKCEIENCEICKVNFQKQEICEICRKGFVREMVSIRGDYRCVREGPGMQNCLTLNPMEKDRCLECRVNYFDDHWSCEVSRGYFVAVMARVFNLFIGFLTVFVIFN